jgi:Flp pilus assembly protein TadB
MITGSFILVSLSPKAFANQLLASLSKRPGSIKNEIKVATQRKKISYFRREISEVQAILKLTGRESWFSMVCALSLLLFVIGSSIAILLGNLFALPVLGIGFMMLPFWYIRLTQSHFKKDIAAELETALSIITTSYLRNEDLLTAIEENVDYLNPPVLSVFKAFLYRIKMVDPDVLAGLKEMKQQIDNAVFREWCEAMIGCQFDRSLKTTLTPIVTKLSDMRVVNGELENMVFEPRKEFITMQILVIGNIPLLYFLNNDWYHTLMHTPLGQLILAVCFAAVFISGAFVIKLTQPIEYRR